MSSKFDARLWQSTVHISPFFVHNGALYNIDGWETPFVAVAPTESGEKPLARSFDRSQHVTWLVVVCHVLMVMFIDDIFVIHT